MRFFGTAAFGRTGILVLLAAGVPLTFATAAGIGEAPGRYPSPLSRRQNAPVPPLTFRIDQEIPLPSKPSSQPLRLEGNHVVVPLAGGGVVWATIEDGPPPRIVAGPGPAAPDDPAAAPWIEASNGRRRFRTFPEGRVDAESRCGWCRSGWRRSWTLRMPAATLSAPTLDGPRIYVASRDGRVYCLRADNGHRVWATDVLDRVSRPVAVWSAMFAQTGPAPRVDPTFELFRLLLVLPDGGRSLVALDLYDGGRIAILDVPASEGRLVGGVAAFRDGRIVVARERYTDPKATLVLLSLARKEPPAESPSGSRGL